MAKTQEELNALKEEYKNLTSKLKDLTSEELEMVTGGFDVPKNDKQYEFNQYNIDTEHTHFFKKSDD